jgi:hypothetical protein
VVLGPQQMPPQGAKALIAGLLGGRRSGPDVSAVLDESEREATVIEFFNQGSATAVELQYVVEDPAGSFTTRAVGDLASGATRRCRIDAPRDPFRLVWRCSDAKGRVRGWAYDGRTKRLRSADTGEAAFRALYR